MTTTSRSRPALSGILILTTQLAELVPVGGAKGACEADESDGEEGHDDCGEADVRSRADEGELGGGGVLQEVLSVHGDAQDDCLSVDLVRRIVSWWCGALDGGGIKVDGVGLTKAAELALDC